mmetsp:Transcript_16711/g.45675  ORF Transcript_16711/g.45675 Transcript_16711/m.45675 type:complete len:224 (+) Transcript_16711:477-1148(+)
MAVGTPGSMGGGGPRVSVFPPHMSAQLGTWGCQGPSARHEVRLPRLCHKDHSPSELSPREVQGRRGGRMGHGRLRKQRRMHHTGGRRGRRLRRRPIATMRPRGRWRRGRRGSMAKELLRSQQLGKRPLGGHLPLDVVGVVSEALGDGVSGVGSGDLVQLRGRWRAVRCRGGGGGGNGYPPTRAPPRHHQPPARPRGVRSADERPHMRTQRAPRANRHARATVA